MSQSFFISVFLSPQASAILPKRSPNFPEFTLKRVFEQRLFTAASIAPVPDEASITTSSVLKSLKRCLRVSSNIASNSGVRWCIVSSPIALRTF